MLAGALLAGHHALAASSPSTASSAQTAPAHAETIHTTANHPWLTADRGWVAAGDLHAGEGIVTLSGAAATVAWVRTVPGQADMYNLTVASGHPYAVGASRAVVHNTGACLSVPEGEYVADSGVFMDRMNSSTQAENCDAILANPNYTLYVPDAAAREVNVTHPVYGPAQAQRLTGTPDGAGIIRLPDPRVDGIDLRTLIQTRGFGSNDMLIVETARARGLPVLTTNQALATQVKDSNYPFRFAQWGQVPIIVIPS